MKGKNVNSLSKKTFFIKQTIKKSHFGEHYRLDVTREKMRMFLAMLPNFPNQSFIFHAINIIWDALNFSIAFNYVFYESYKT